MLKSFPRLARSARAALVFASAAAIYASGTSIALADFGLGAQINYQTPVTVGQTNLAGNVEFKNTSSAGLTITIDNVIDRIVVIPSCGGYSGITCSVLDAGVFQINPTATGTAGTACAGLNFSVTPTGNADGSVYFTPNPVTAINFGVVGSATEKCRIDFTFNVLKVPAVDASGLPGVQTRPGTIATGVASDSTIGLGFGTTFVTVEKAGPGLATTASPTVVAPNNIYDTATLSGGVNPTGTITFRLYAPGDTTCSTAISTTNVTVNGNGSYQSPNYLATLAGTYRWIASYSGDANNAAVSGACNDSGESVVVTNGNPSLTTMASAAIKLGGTIHDVATLANGAAPTGTITFNLYGPNDATCGNAPIYTSTVNVTSGNGNYTSGSFTPTAIGTYRWVASYSGDGNNNPIAGNCNDPNESVVVSQATPGIVTQASATGQVGVVALSDTATLSNGYNPTGTITFNLYGPNNNSCTGPAIFTSTVTVNGNGNYTSTPTFSPTAPGTYRWTASYSGDTNNAGISHPCNAQNESTVVNRRSASIVTTASAGGGIGTQIQDSATVTGTNPTGTVTFNLYAPTDAACNGPAVFSETVTLSGGSATSSYFTTTQAGTYRWRATYNGDANNTTATHACGSAGETAIITKSSPSIATTATVSALMGGTIADVATVSGGTNPTGTVTFNLYGPNDATCSGASVFTATVALSGGSANSGNYTPTAPGTYRWTASYSGDANNNGISHPCNSANETSTVNKASPSIATTATVSALMGGTIADVATVSGGTNPTGTVTFNLYGPNDATCSGASVFTATVALSGGSANSGNYTPTAPGTYRWTASYSGDANNNGISHPCNSANETSTVNKASPSIATTATVSALMGGTIADVATVSGGTNPTGTVTFNLYGPNDATCSGASVFTATVALSGGSANSGNYTPTAPGTYRWTASYSGDANNNGISHPCNSANETSTVNKANPTIATSATASAPVGGNIADTATVSGGTNPTGTVTFNLYGPNDATCSGASVFTATVALSGGSANSGNYTPTAPGTYRWTASYSGDANNNGISHPCNSANETSTVGKASPAIVTSATAGPVNLGASISDQATLSGGVSPTGTITFTAYGPNDATCSTAVFTSAPVAVNGNGAYNSGAFTPAAVGTYRWIASYTGDANNNAVSGACNDPGESSVVAKATPAIVTQASAGGPVGTQVTDTATVSGGNNPTGTVTFNLYAPGDVTCTGTPVFTSTKPLAAGSATSDPYTTTQAGTFRWTATYSGDAGNDSVAHPCNATNESVVITPVVLTLVTQTTSAVRLGTPIHDTATISGGANPTGTLTFRLYGPNDASCSAAPAFTSTPVAVNGNGNYDSPPFTPASIGTYRWVASYSGDDNNQPYTAPCNDANENVTVSKEPPPPTSVPTLSEWGLMLMSLMLAAFAMAGMRRRTRR